MGKKTELKLNCEFCGTPTNFKDNDHDYCIDCYVKLRNSAHTHPLPVNPQPLTPINPFPVSPPIYPNYPNPITQPTIIC